MMYKTKSTLDYKRGHGATINPDAIDYATSIVEKISWQRRSGTSRTSPSMAAEDFSAYFIK